MTLFDDFVYKDHFDYQPDIEEFSYMGHKYIVNYVFSKYMYKMIITNKDLDVNLEYDCSFSNGIWVADLTYRCPKDTYELINDLCYVFRLNVKAMLPAIFFTDKYVFIYENQIERPETKDDTSILNRLAEFFKLKNDELILGYSANFLKTKQINNVKYAKLFNSKKQSITHISIMSFEHCLLIPYLKPFPCVLSKKETIIDLEYPEIKLRILMTDYQTLLFSILNAKKNAPISSIEIKLGRNDVVVGYLDLTNFYNNKDDKILSSGYEFLKYFLKLVKSYGVNTVELYDESRIYCPDSNKYFPLWIVKLICSGKTFYEEVGFKVSNTMMLQVRDEFINSKKSKLDTELLCSNYKTKDCVAVYEQVQDIEKTYLKIAVMYFIDLDNF